MKPFNLEQAKAGKPVCTRDGRDAEIIKYDLKEKDKVYPLVTIIANSFGESVYSHTEEGLWLTGAGSSVSDLFMKAEKKEGWINVYKGSPLERYTGSKVFPNAEEAASTGLNNDCIATIKIEWEE